MRVPDGLSRSRAVVHADVERVGRELGVEESAPITPHVSSLVRPGSRIHDGGLVAGLSLTGSSSDTGVVSCVLVMDSILPLGVQHNED